MTKKLYTTFISAMHPICCGLDVHKNRENLKDLGKGYLSGTNQAKKISKLNLDYS